MFQDLFIANYRNNPAEKSLSNHNIWRTREKHTRKNEKGLILKIRGYERVRLIIHHYVNQIHFF
jgi:hypothetical protein